MNRPRNISIGDIVQHIKDNKIDICPDTGCWNHTGKSLQPSTNVDGKYIKSTTLFKFHYHGEERPPGKVLGHLCDNQRCCNPDHLKYMTVEERINTGKCLERMSKAKRGIKNAEAKLTQAQVEEIRASDKTQVELAKIYKTTQPNISRIINKETWDS